MTTEFDLACATCGGALAKQSVAATDVSLTGVSGTLSVAQCIECGSRYFPETTLERL